MLNPWPLPLEQRADIETMSATYTREKTKTKNDFLSKNDRCEQSLHDTDALKTERYTPLRDQLERLLLAWEVDIQRYTVGIRGSHDPDRWHAILGRLGMTAARADRLIQDMVSQALTELTDLYNIRYAALQRQQQAQHV